MLSHSDPFTAFAAWYTDACASEPDVPDAMQLATVEPIDPLRPALRTVLLKSHGPEGFVFYTNLHSRKGRNLAANPVASALFHWKSLERQVIVEGDVHRVSDAASDAYFATRPRGSQLGAWASLQSAPLPDRATLLQRLAEVEARFAGQPVPRPPQWCGQCIVPHRVEFWQGRSDRLHERTVFTRPGGPGAPWEITLLYP